MVQTTEPKNAFKQLAYFFKLQLEQLTYALKLKVVVFMHFALKMRKNKKRSSPDTVINFFVQP